MSEKRSLVDIFEDQTYGIRNTGYSDQLTNIPKLITENLKYTPYYFQKEAIENFVFYMDADENPVTKVKLREKNEPVHLMFNMATGSGKTLIMAANIVFLISKGYRKFLFITHQTNIVNKTKENLTNSQHQKYLFKEKIIIDSKIINLKEVDKFSNTDNYEIRYTTIHKLHAELSPTNIRENTNSQDELNKLNLVILADEGHHFNVESSKNSQKQTDENSKPEDIEQNWETTLINKVFKKNFSELVNNNVLLEYTATVPDSENIANKYLDKTIYSFDLKKFMTAKLTKEINLVTLSLDRKQKIIYALSFNWYRHKLALKYNIPNFKPVILFRRKRVEESNDDFEYFFEVVENLELNDLSFFEKDIPRNSNAGSVHEQGLSRTQEIYNLLKSDKSKNEFIQYVKNNFKRDINVVITNSKTNKTKKEKIEKNLENELNNLEDPNNSIRAIFTVKRLTEGWDVQNLYDIVRMDTTQNTGGKTKGPPPATVEEKQLIGRAVRFNPYKLNNEQILKRQFDDNLDNELRILEEFYYFTYDDKESRYISELKAELVREGYIKEKNELINFQLKNSFTKKQFYKNTSLWINSQISGEEYYVSSLNELEEIVEINLPDLSISEERLGSNLESISTAQFSGNLKEFDASINLFDNHIVLKSLNKLNKSFKDVTQLLEVETYSQLNKNKILNKFTLRISSVHKSIETMNGAEKLFVLEKFFETLLIKMETLLKRKYGDTSFKPVLLSDFFNKPKQKSIDTENISLQSINVLKEIENEPWYVVEALKKDSKEKLSFLPSTDQELNFLQLFKSTFTTKLDEITDEYYLIRNEEQDKLFDFESGEGFMPDFLLFIKLNKELIYLILIEPKGLHLFEQDKWKEEFLKAINSLYGLNAKKLKEDNIAYNLIGLPFYNSEQSESFRAKFQEIFN